MMKANNDLTLFCLLAFIFLCSFSGLAASSYSCPAVSSVPFGLGVGNWIWAGMQYDALPMCSSTQTASILRINPAQFLGAKAVMSVSGGNPSIACEYGNIPAPGNPIIVTPFRTVNGVNNPPMLRSMTEDIRLTTDISKNCIPKVGSTHWNNGTCTGNGDASKCKFTCQ